MLYQPNNQKWNHEPSKYCSNYALKGKKQKRTTHEVSLVLTTQMDAARRAIYTSYTVSKNVDTSFSSTYRPLVLDLSFSRVLRQAACAHRGSPQEQKESDCSSIAQRVQRELRSSPHAARNRWCQLQCTRTQKDGASYQGTNWLIVSTSFAFVSQLRQDSMSMQLLSKHFQKIEVR